MKKMYKKPETEIAAFVTEQMQLMSTMSPAGGNGPGGSAGNDAPRRRGEIID